MINNHFLNKVVGAVDAIKGQLDDVTIEMYFQKESNYTMTLMSSYGTLELMDKEKNRNYYENNQNHCEKIKYSKLDYNHYQYRDSVDACNSSSIFPIAMEET